MTALLRKLKGRKAALAIFAVVALVALSLAAVPVILLFAAQNHDINNAVRQSAVYQAEIASRGRLEAQLDELRQRAASESSLIQSDSAALAEAQLQSAMKAIVANSQGEVRSAQPLPPTKDGSFEVISVAYDVIVPLARFSALAYAVENHTPSFFIDDAELTPGQAWDTGDPVSAGGIPKLEVRWTVRAYRWGGAR